MKHLKIIIVSLCLLLIVIISCKNIKNNASNSNNYKATKNIDSFSVLPLVDKDTLEKVIWFRPNMELDSQDYILAKKFNRPIILEDPYKYKGDSVYLSLCDKSFDKYLIRPGFEGYFLKSDTGFMECFLNHFATTKGFTLTQKEIIDIIDKFEDDFIENYNYETGEIVLENELKNTTQWHFSKNHAKKIIYSLDIPEKFNRYISQCETVLLLKDTASLNRIQNELVSEFLNMIQDLTIPIYQKQNLVKVVGYFIFVRFKNNFESFRINEAFLPKVDNDKIHNLLKENQLEQLSLLLAKYNAHLYETSRLETFYNAAYYFYKNYLQVIDEKYSYQSTCPVREEIVRFLMYANQDEAVHRKALDLVENEGFDGYIPDRWMALRSELHKRQASSYYGSEFTDSIRKHHIISANSILQFFNQTNDTIALSIANLTLAGMFWYKGSLQDALYHDFTSHSLSSKISFYERKNQNYGQTVLNIPFYLYKLGQKKEAIFLFEYIIQKKFHEQYYADNLQMQFDLFLYDNQFSLAKSTCIRMLDSAEIRNDNSLKHRSYFNLIQLAKAEGNTELEKHYTSLAFNTYAGSYNSNPYLAGIVDVIDTKMDALILADSLFIFQHRIIANKEIITKQQHYISSLNNNLLMLNDSLVLNTDRLRVLNDSMKILDYTIRSKIDTIGTLKYLDSTKNIEIIAKNLALLQKEEALNAEKKANHIALGVIGLLLFTICLVIWSSIRFYRERNRANASEANQRILSRTMYQLGHLGPQCINNLVTSVEEESGMDRSKLVSRLDVLSELLRKFYDYSKEKFITYRDEYDLACAYVDIAYEKKDQTISPSDIIKSNYKENSEVIMPTFVAFNAIQNAFKHGKIANYNVTDNVPLLNIQLSNCNNNVLQMKIENKKKVHENSTKLGSGLNFIEGALQYWNGDKKNKKKYSTIDETEDKFILTYFFKSKHSDEV